MHRSAACIARPGERRLGRGGNRLQHVHKLRPDTLGKLAKVVYALPVLAREAVRVHDLHDVLDALLPFTLRRLPHRPGCQILDQREVVASHAGAVRLEGIGGHRVRMYLVEQPLHLTRGRVLAEPAREPVEVPLVLVEGFSATAHHACGHNRRNHVGVGHQAPVLFHANGPVHDVAV